MLPFNPHLKKWRQHLLLEIKQKGNDGHNTVDAVVE